MFLFLRKILKLCYRFDTSWKLATVTSLFVMMGYIILLPVNAQSQNGTSDNNNSNTPSTSTSNNIDTEVYGICQGSSGAGSLTSALRYVAKTALGSSQCFEATSGIALATISEGSTGAQPSSSDTSNTGYSPSYFREGGLIGAAMFMGGATMDYRPSSTYEAVRYQAEKAGFKVSAQVQGFNQLGPITTLWGVFRNISLLLFAVVFVAIGFFILIQRRIGGQETVSLVSGLVNAGVAMVVIAFSYAIGGLVIDVFINVMNGVVATTFNGFINAQEILAKLNSPNSGVSVLTLMSELTNIGVSQSASNLFGTALTGLSYPAQQVKGVFGNINANIGFIPIGSAIGLFASAFVDILIGIITTAFNNNSLINAIVAFIIFIISIRVVLTLITAYISLVFKIMFAPFILLPAAFPGNSGKAIFGWLISLIATALTFPAVFACLLMSAMFLNLNANLEKDSESKCQYSSVLNPGNSSTIQGNTVKSKVFVVTRLGQGTVGSGAERTECYPLVLPPKFNQWPAPLGYLTGVEPDDLIRFVIALAFIILTPSIPKILQAVLKVPQDNLLAGISQGFKQGTGAFSQFIAAVPSFGVGKAIGSVTRGAAESAS